MCAGTWAAQDTLSTEEMILKLQAGSQQGFDEVVISGGEPTIRNDIDTIVNAAKQLGYQSIVLQTNARRLSKNDFTKKLINAGITRFLVSLHGANSLQHDNQTRISGRFDQAIAGIRNIIDLSNESTRVGVHSVILPNNYKSLSEIVDLISLLGIPIIKMSYVVPVGRGSGIYNGNAQPKMTETVPYLTSAIDDFVSIYHHKPMTSISVGYMPLCILPGYEEFSDEKNAPPTYFMNDNYKLELAEEQITSRGLKSKRENCKLCKYNLVCTGVWREYTEYFGWDEFIPVE